MKFKKIRIGTKVDTYDSGVTAVSKVLEKYSKQENKNIITLRKLNNIGSKVTATSILPKHLESIVKQSELSLRDGLGYCGIALINIELYYENIKTDDNNGHYIYYERDTHGDYLIYDNWNSEVVKLDYDTLVNMSADVVIDKINFNNYIKTVYIDKKDIFDIKDLFAYHLVSVKPGTELTHRLKMFRLTWSQKDSQYIEFLGSNLMGAHQIRFSTNDEDLIFIDILNVDKNILKTDIFNLEGIDRTWKVTSNNVYLTIVYLIHAYAVSHLSPQEKEEGIRECYYVFAYKAISSLLSYYFSFQVDIGLAKAVYERLSNRFLLKRLGNWQSVFEYRALDVLPNGLHYPKILTLSTDDAVKIVADLQGRIRELVKNIYSVLMEVKDNNEKINSTSMINTNDEEGDSIKDNTTRPDIYIGYIRNIFNKPNDFVNDDLVYLICSIFPKLDSVKFVDTLKYLSQNITPARGSEEDFIENSINLSLQYLRSKNIVNNYNEQAYEIIKHLKGFWSSSSVKDPLVKKTKNVLFAHTKKATGKKTTWLLASISISTILYIFVRSLYRNKN